MASHNPVNPQGFRGFSLSFTQDGQFLIVDIPDGKTAAELVIMEV
jgi:hypothetical protein